MVAAPMPANTPLDVVAQDLAWEVLHLHDDEQQKATTPVECESFTFMSCSDITSSVRFFPDCEGGASDLESYIKTDEILSGLSSSCSDLRIDSRGLQEEERGASGSIDRGRGNGRGRAKFMSVYKLLNVVVSSLKGNHVIDAPSHRPRSVPLRLPPSNSLPRQSAGDQLLQAGKWVTSDRALAEWSRREEWRCQGVEARSFDGGVAVGVEFFDREVAGVFAKESYGSNLQG
ncbi:hypothetical protein CRG98_027815 [Punica granatum]|uniref:Uncharacterized protein n=1 Tax=Punica granatum TaxID=22663 RepID=A0A2I0J6C1_PUNGR|nr:hypothetical protein CRG98_027815 [Punica granatum]